MTRLDWEINITNLVDSVAKKYDAEVARTPFARCGATCLDDLTVLSFRNSARAKRTLPRLPDGVG